MRVALLLCGMALAAPSYAQGHGASEAQARVEPSFADSTKPPQREIDKLTSGSLVEIGKVEALPASCREAFAKLTHEAAFALANPGQPYQATDAIGPGQPLPWRRLIFGGLSRDRCLVYYELGGIAATQAVVVFDLSTAGKATLSWGGVDGGKVPDLPSLVSRMAGGAFRQGGPGRW